MIKIAQGDPYKGESYSYQKGLTQTEDYIPNKSSDSALVNGQPKLNPKTSSETAKTFYVMGRTSAALDQKRQDIEHANSALLVQHIMLEQLKSQIQNVLMSTVLNQKMLETQQANQFPPLPSGGGGFPPLPQGDDTGGGMSQGQPDMSQGGGLPDMSQGMPQGQPQYQGQ
jgi:hypothetical protein